MLEIARTQIPAPTLEEKSTYGGRPMSVGGPRGLASARVRPRGTLTCVEVGVEEPGGVPRRDESLATRRLSPLPWRQPEARRERTPMITAAGSAHRDTAMARGSLHVD